MQAVHEALGSWDRLRGPSTGEQLEGQQRVAHAVVHNQAEATAPARWERWRGPRLPLAAITQGRHDPSDGRRRRDRELCSNQL